MAQEKKLPRFFGKTGWCPGCGHGVFMRLILELLEEKGLMENNVCMTGVGCSANYNMFKNGNKVEAHHGRAPSVGNGMKAILPDTFVWTYQGDGDAYAIGMGESVLAAQAGYPLTVFVINNCNYGMTGGQTAKTTLTGQKTTTDVNGYQGIPFDFMKVVKQMEKVTYAARGTTANYTEIVKLKKYMSKAMDVQINEGGYSVVEIICPCPTNWHKTPLEAVDWVENEVTKVFKLGEFKDHDIISEQ